MKTKVVILFALIISARTAISQVIVNPPTATNEDWLWSKYQYCILSNPNCLSTDPQGNVIETGYFKCTSINMDNTIEHMLTNCMYNDEDIFVLKYNPSGKIQWVSRMHGWGKDNPGAICTDASGNIYVSGFYDGPNIIIESTKTQSGGTRNMFLTKYNSLGSVMWACSNNLSSHTIPTAMSNANNGIVLAGYFSDTAVFSGSNYFKAAVLSEDVFVAKYNYNGQTQWAKAYGSNGDERILSVACDKQGYAFLTGYFKSSNLIFGNDTLYRGTAAVASFIAMLDNNGNEMWAKVLSNNLSNMQTSAVTVDNKGAFYLSGHFSGKYLNYGGIQLANVDTTGSSSDVFYAKFDVNGVLLNIKSFGSSNDDKSTAISYGKELSIAGNFSGPQMLMGSNTLLNDQSGTNDVFLTKIDSACNIKSTLTAGGALNDAIYCLAADAFGNDYVMGYFYDNSIVMKDTLKSQCSPCQNNFVAKAGLNKLVVNNNTTGISGFDQSENPLAIFPNPAKSILTIQNIAIGNNICIKDLLGRTCILTKSDANTMQVNLQDLNVGLYYLEIQNKDSSKVVKFIKE